MTETVYCVIGAGFSGLGIARALRENGLRVEVLERNDDLGGNWLDGVYDSTHLISSRDTTGYREFPMPRDWPDFPNRGLVLSYLRSYADRYGLRELIEFGVEVVRAEPASPDGMAGWRVTVGLADGSVETRHYTAVIVCTGHHWDRVIPDRPGEFTGRQLHSKDYRNPGDLKGDRVLVVGAGVSGCDIAVEVGRQRGGALISMRRGYHFVPRTVFGRPVAVVDRPWLPRWAQRTVLRSVLWFSHGPNRRYGLPEPDHKLFQQRWVVNSDLLHALRDGTVCYRPDIARFDGRTVHFVDGSADEVDLIVWATGYRISFPFLDHDLFEWEHGVPKRVAGFLPPRCANLYVFGLLQPRGGAGPLISEGAQLLVQLIGIQAGVDRPIATDIARARPAQAQHLVGVSQTLRQIRVGRWLLSRYARRVLPQDPRDPGAGEVRARS